MFKKTITYTDYNGEKRTEDFYFNLTKAEIAELQVSKNGTLSEYIQRIRQTNDIPELAKLFKTIILTAYGEKSLDGKYFWKERDGHKLADDFAQTEAFSDLYIELAQNDDAAADFLMKLIPTEYAAQISKKMQEESPTEFARNVVK